LHIHALLKVPFKKACRDIWAQLLGAEGGDVAKKIWTQVHMYGQKTEIPSEILLCI